MNTKINYQNITDLIFTEFSTIINNNPKYKDITLFVDNEQEFIHREKIDNPQSLYVVVKFGEATVNFGSSILPITLLVFGLGNKIALTQELLNEFVNSFNLNLSNGIQQIYMSPNAIQHFIEASDDFRSLFSIGGTILIGSNISRLESLIYTNDKGVEESIQVLSYDDETVQNVNPQPYSGTFGKTKSYVNFQTFTFSITTYPIDSNLVNDVMRVKYKEDNINRDFKIDLSFTNGITMKGFSFKLSNSKYINKIGETPIITMTFTL